MRQTLRGLAIGLVALACTFPAWVATPASAGGVHLHRGSRGVQVKVLETRLQVLGLLAKRQVDRRYTRPTVRAVKRFQRQHRLRVNGRVNNRVWTAIARAAAARLAPKPPPAPVILGHRGAVVSGIDENTLQSMQYASSSADVLEFDVRLTSDHQFVLLHDATLDRTTDCTGPLTSITLADLEANCLTATGQRVPTLDEVTAYAAQVHKAISPEIKMQTISDEDLAAFVGIIDAHGMDTRSYVQSFFPALFPRLRALDGRLGLVYLASSSTPAETIRASGVTIAGINLAGLTATGVAAYQRAGLRVWAWTAGTQTQLRSLWAMRVNGVFTNLPRDAAAIYHAS